MAQRLPNYLRTFRKRAGLSQPEVARLLGRKSGTFVSRCENGRRTISLETALAFSVIYGISVKELFAGMYTQVETAVRKRARGMNSPPSTLTDHISL